MSKSCLDGTITINSSEYRPCIANGKKALFHKWVEKESAILTCHYRLSDDKLKTIRKTVDETGVVPIGFSIEKIKISGALIEFEDGSIKEVETTYVRFLDSRGLFYEHEVFFEGEQ